VDPLGGFFSYITDWASDQQERSLQVVTNYVYDYSPTAASAIDTVGGCAIGFTRSVSRAVDLPRHVTIDAPVATYQAGRARVQVAGENPFIAYSHEAVRRFTPYGVGEGLTEAIIGESRDVATWGDPLSGYDRFMRVNNFVGTTAAMLYGQARTQQLMNQARQRALQQAQAASKPPVCPCPPAPVSVAKQPTYVLGRQVDTAVAKDWAGHSVLDIPDWTLAKNDAWIKNIVDTRGTVYLGSPQTRATLWDAVNNRPTVFARVLEQLRAAGYTQVGDYMLPPGVK
jgi:hypothetical protein